MNIIDLMSERAQENDRFKSIVLKPTQDELQEIHSLIRVFPNLRSLDYFPTKFIRLVGEYYGYTFLETEDEEVQREILKRIIKEYHNKGIPKTISNIANRAYDDNFFLGNLSFYRDRIEDAYSSIEYPREKMFRYDYSKWDSGSRWPDLIEWRDGVIQINMSRPTDRTYKLLDEYLPAGIKYVHSDIRDLAGDTNYVDMVMNLLDDIYDQWIIQDLGYTLPYLQLGDHFRWDYSRWDYSKWESRNYITVDHWEEKKPQAAIHRIFYPIDFGYSVAEVYGEPYMWNWNRFCGIIGGYAEPDTYDKDIGGIVNYPYKTDGIELTYESGVEPLKPYAKGDEIYLDITRLDSSKWDSHIVASVEVLALDDKPKIQFIYDNTVTDRSIYDGNPSDKEFNIDYKDIGEVNISYKVKDVLSTIDSTSEIPKVYARNNEVYFDKSRLDNSKWDSHYSSSIDIFVVDGTPKIPFALDETELDNSVYDGNPSDTGFNVEYRDIEGTVYPFKTEGVGIIVQKDELLGPFARSDEMYLDITRFDDFKWDSHIPSTVEVLALDDKPKLRFSYDEEEIDDSIYDGNFQ